MEKIAVYGAGTIGACQATLVIGNGLPCVVVGHSEKGLERCEAAILQNWDDLIREGLASPENKDAAMSLLTITNDPARLADCGFVFEAITESEEQKRQVFQMVERYAAADVIIASCTSSIDAEKLAALTNNPEALLIAHPFQPVHMLPLVEVVRHSKTSDRTLQRTVKLLELLRRKVIILNHSVPGFLVNRFAQALFREAIYLIEEGVTTAFDIDTAIKYAMGMRYGSIGLLEYYDAVGFELEKTIAENVYPDLCDVKAVQKTTLEGISEGKTGQRSGQGFYDWTNKDGADFRYRRQSPYFESVREWSMPG